MQFAAMAARVTCAAAHTAVSPTTIAIIRTDWVYYCPCRPWEARVAPGLDPGSAKSACGWCRFPLTWRMTRTIAEIAKEDVDEEEEEDQQ